MASSTYIVGRRKYERPQAILWADNPGTLTDGIFVPNGDEKRSDGASPSFIILTDDNRSDISFTPERIEKRERMINSRMRSYHVADKLKISLSWDMIPSRSFSLDANWDSEGTPTAPAGGTLKTSYPQNVDGNYLYQYTTDGGAGGVDLLDWYETHTGPFWVYLAYDKFNNFDGEDSKYGHLAQYNQIIQMYISDFSYSVQKRGGTNYDFWNVSVSLEEV